MTEPRMRAGDSDRQAAVDRLTAHFTDGRLDADEYDERVGKAYAATFTDQFADLFVDLPDEKATRADHSGWPGADGFGPRGFGPRGFGPGGFGPGRSSDEPPSGPPWARGRRRPPRILPVIAVLGVLFVVGAVINGLFFFPFPLIWIAIAVVMFSRGGCHRRLSQSGGPGYRSFGGRR